jgi:hypothetical protein
MKLRKGTSNGLVMNTVIKFGFHKRCGNCRPAE